MPKPITLPIKATLEIDPKEVDFLSEEDPEKLRRLVFEFLETIVRVELSRPRNGSRGVKGFVRFATPTPAEINDARLGNRSEA